MTDVPLTAMIEAARATAAHLQSQPTPPVAASMSVFLDQFHAFERPATDQLRRRLDELRPGVPWTDEFDTRIDADTERWVVDVMDGAVQFLQGLPHWCVSITLARGSSPLAAVLHQPIFDETYAAAIDIRTTRNGDAVTPSTKRNFEVALLATSAPPGVAGDSVAVRRAGESTSALLRVAGAVRNYGPTSWQIADVGAGRIDAFWEYGADTANLLGASLIAVQAGAIVSDTDGGQWGPDASGFVVAGPDLHRAMLDALAGVE